MKNILFGLSVCLIACSQGERNTVVVEEPSRDTTMTSNTHEPDRIILHFLHKKFGQFYTCVTVEAYDTVFFKPVNYANEVNSIIGLEYKGEEGEQFNILTEYDTTTMVIGITSTHPEFGLSNGVTVGMTVEDLLALDTNLTFYNEDGDHSAHFGGNGYYAYVDNIGNQVDPNVEYGKQLNAQVNPSATVSSLAIWRDDCE